MNEVKEPCGKCGHSLAAHTKNVREEDLRKKGIMSVDPALLPPKPPDPYSGRPAGESGCTECPCRRWEPEEVPVMKVWTIRIKSGPMAGRWVGGRFGGGLVTNPEILKNPPVNIDGSTKYGLWAQERGAMKFFETGLGAALEELTKLGYELDILKVQG